MSQNILKKPKFNFFNKNEELFKSINKKTLLTCHRLTRSFGALKAVNNLSFEIQPGLIFGIGGPNGAGKTTLFDVISGLQKANRGEVIFKGQNITNQSPYKICHSGIARTFQLNAAFETMTVKENVLIGVQHGIGFTEIPSLYFSRQDIINAEHALSFVGLSDISNKIVSSLTHLEIKLLMIASAISTNPSLLLLDEPVGGLIPSEIEKIEKIVTKLIKEKQVTVILIEHVMRFLVGLSDEVLIMNQGEKLYQGIPEKMAEDKAVVEVYLGEGTSANIEKITSARKNKGIETPIANTDLPDEIYDEWAFSIEKTSRELIKQRKIGKLYPIDFMKLENLLDLKKEKGKTTKISRAAEGLINARKINADLTQHFELLERMIEENTHLRFRLPKTMINDDDREKNRAKNIERAALQLLQKNNENSLPKKEMEQLHQAIMSNSKSQEPVISGDKSDK